jgi:hypothetical protein
MLQVVKSSLAQAAGLIRFKVSKPDEDPDPGIDLQQYG